MLDYIGFIIMYFIYLTFIYVYNEIIPNQIIQYMHNRNVELDELNVDIPNKFYYFQNEYGNIEIRAPILIPINE
jgi:hypothetical protein